MQALELPTSVHPFFVGTQAHPELQSRPMRPQPMFVGLVRAALERARQRAETVETQRQPTTA